MTSDKALAELRPALVALGFDIEGGKQAADKLRRPVLFGEQAGKNGHTKSTGSTLRTGVRPSRWVERAAWRPCFRSGWCAVCWLGAVGWSSDGLGFACVKLWRCTSGSSFWSEGVACLRSEPGGFGVCPAGGRYGGSAGAGLRGLICGGVAPRVAPCGWAYAL